MNRNARQRTRFNLRVFGGSSHPDLTKSVARKVGVRIGEVTLKKFANNETSVVLNENVRGKDVYVIQTGGRANPNDDLMELLLLVNSFKLASVNCVNVITPYFFYSKGDQKNSYKRVPITAKLVSNLLRKAGADQVMIIDPHTPQLEGFFDTPVDALKVEPLFCEWIKKHVPDWKTCVVVSPDEGSAKRCTSVANDLNLEFALINSRKDVHKKHKYKHRRKRNTSAVSTASRDRHSSERDVDGVDESEASVTADESTSKIERRMTNLAVTMTRTHKKISLSGSVTGRTVIMVDDMIDTGRTIKSAIDTLKRFGATGVYIFVTHAIFSGESVATMHANKDFIKKIVSTNTIPQKLNQEKLEDMLHIMDIGGLVAEYVRRHHYHESVSVLGHYMPIRNAVGDLGNLQDDEVEALVAADVDNPNEIIDAASEASGDESSGEEEAIAEILEDVAAEAAAAAEINASEDNDGLADIVEAADGEGEGEGGAAALVADGAASAAESEQARDRRLMHLRKGFRLSSMCWDD